jgi:flagellar biosynthesis protein FlhG
VRRARRIIAVGGGKGGAGKSLLAANVGIFLATIGKRVVLLDADLGGANLHTFVGVERPPLSLEPVVVETAVPGLGLVSGEGPSQKLRLLEEVQRLDVEYLIVDLGPGSGSTAIDFFLHADVGVLVVVPEPTSVESTFRFIKSAFARRLRQHGLEVDGVPAPLDLLPSEPILEQMATFRPCVVVNQVRTRSDEDLGPALAQAARRRLGLAIDYLGHIDHDDAVWLAVRKRRPLLVEHPDSLSAKGIERVTRRLMALETAEAVFRPPGAQTHYEVLELEPAAADEEIRRAYRRLRETYSPESLVVSGLYTQDKLAELHRRFEEAYDVLMDSTRRRAYDVASFPDGVPAPVQEVGSRKMTPAPGIPVVDEPPRPQRPEPEIGPHTPITGPLLKQLREARGIDIHEISHKTKIGVGHLRAIEDERFDLLPAVVYVRGFLQEYAKALRLDVAHVLATLLERIRAAKAQMEDRG